MFKFIEMINGLLREAGFDIHELSFHIMAGYQPNYDRDTPQLQTDKSN